jgi:hypothetical protein
VSIILVYMLRVTSVVYSCLAFAERTSAYDGLSRGNSAIALHDDVVRQSGTQRNNMFHHYVVKLCCEDCAMAFTTEHAAPANIFGSLLQQTKYAAG